MTPRLSKAVLTSHITFSVGWLGAVAVFLALAITGLTSPNIQLVRSSYLAMELSAWFVIVPFSLTSLFTGIIQAVGTRWGLFKYYWIVVKLFLTVASTALLLLHLQPIRYLADAAADASFSNAQQAGQLIQLIAKAGAAVLVLIAITTISVYKPWGKTPFAGKGNPLLAKQINGKNAKKPWVFYVLAGLLGLLIIFILLHHLFGGGMPRH